jgi:GH15 family glucan-1,4-alpha-glucosidase
MAGGLVLRYRTAENIDGLPPGEGAFLACSFWLADAYALLGRYDDAERLFEHPCRIATTSACSRRSTTRAHSASSATSRRAFPTSP